MELKKLFSPHENREKSIKMSVYYQRRTCYHIIMSDKVKGGSCRKNYMNGGIVWADYLTQTILSGDF